MPPIYFASSNSEKFDMARYLCTKADIPIEQIFIDIDEIQGEDPIPIVKHKAAAAFQAFGKPVVVSDDSWEIPALNGFPGAYMKSMNFWFTPDDFIHLMIDKTNRSVFLHQHLAYCDGKQTLVFNDTIPGTVLTEPRGKTIPHKAWMSVVSIEGDHGLSLSEVFSAEKQLSNDRYDDRSTAWRELIEWYKKQSV